MNITSYLDLKFVIMLVCSVLVYVFYKHIYKKEKNEMIKKIYFIARLSALSTTFFYLMGLFKLLTPLILQLPLIVCYVLLLWFVIGYLIFWLSRLALIPIALFGPKEYFRIGFIRKIVEILKKQK